MKVDKKGNIIMIKDTQGDLKSFIKKLSNEFHSYKEDNIIINLSLHKKLALKDILLFKDLSDRHKILKKSFVLVVSDFDFDKVPEKIIVVPTLLEAHDIIEMEEIERDLGF